MPPYPLRRRQCYLIHRDYFSDPPLNTTHISLFPYTLYRLPHLPYSPIPLFPYSPKTYLFAIFPLSRYARGVMCLRSLKRRLKLLRL